MATELPIVISKEDHHHGRHVELLPLKNGLVFERGNWEELAQKLERLALSPETRHEMGKRSRTLARSAFDWKAIIGQFLVLYSGKGSNVS